MTMTDDGILEARGQGFKGLRHLTGHRCSGARLATNHREKPP
jgi:ribosomal protein S13